MVNEQGIGQALGGQLELAKSSAGQYAAAREKAQTIVDAQVKEHLREFSGWNWLKTAMEKNPPTSSEEESLHLILSRARRERY